MYKPHLDTISNLHDQEKYLQYRKPPNRKKKRKTHHPKLLYVCLEMKLILIKTSSETKQPALN